MKTQLYIPNNELMDQSSELRDDYNRFVREVKRSQHAPHDFRIIFAEKYLSGRGLEIGAFHSPIPLSNNCYADYLDIVDSETLKSWWPDYKDVYSVHPSIIDNGELLSKVKPDSYDFLIANHMLEHTENVFKTIENHIRVVKDGGYVFYAIPDKRYTFDKDRDLTTYEHLKDEYLHGAEQNKRDHFMEFGRVCKKIENNDDLEDYVNKRIPKNRDIHFHVWQYDTFIDHISHWISDSKLNIEIVEHALNGTEFIVILRVLTQIEVAERLIVNGELDKAKEILSDLSKSDNKNLEVQNDLAVIAIMEERYDDAQNLILYVLKIDESNEIALGNDQFLKDLLKNSQC